MASCHHRKRMCDICGSCPRCPQCVCHGERRGRGRPRKLQRRRQRSSAAAALENIRNTARIEHSNDKREWEEDTASRTVVDTPAALLPVLGIPRWAMRYVPSPEKRGARFTDLTMKERESLHQVMDICLSSISKILLPSDADVLPRSFVEDNVLDSRIRGALVDGIKSSKRGSVEKRTLLALLCSTSKAEDVNMWLQGHGDDLSVCELPSEDENDNSLGECGLNAPGSDGGVTGSNQLKLTGDNEATTMNNGEREDTAPFSCHVSGCLLDSSGERGTARV